MNARVRGALTVPQNTALSKITRNGPLISDELLTELKKNTRHRQIELGTRCLRNCAHIFKAFDPKLENAAAFLGSLAQWPYVPPGLLKRLVANFSEESRSGMTIVEYADVQLAEGVVALNDGAVHSAMKHFDVVLQLYQTTTNQGTLAMANYFKARCLHLIGEYDEGLRHVEKARDLESRSSHIHTEAVFKILSGLILFAKRDQNNAIRDLHDAEAVLINTDDYCALGQIQIAYAQMAQHDGHYARAIKHLLRAIDEFKRSGSMDHYVAQSLLDVTEIRLLLVRRIRRTIDIEAEGLRKTGACREIPSQQATKTLRQDLAGLRDEINDGLNRAAQIYRKHVTSAGLSRVHLCRGSLFLELGRFDAASKEADEAYSLCPVKQYSQLALARILQCMVENAIVEEQIGVSVEHALTARGYAHDAIESAKHTPDKRLLARAYICLGLTLSNCVFNWRDGAREAMEQAAKYIEVGNHDGVMDDFQILTRRLVQGEALVSTLLEWAHGRTETKSFKELQEDFADLVIPNVLYQQGRKVSRVATSLSISPKKVRRVLARLGLHETGHVLRQQGERTRRTRCVVESPRHPAARVSSKLRGERTFAVRNYELERQCRKSPHTLQ